MEIPTAIDGGFCVKRLDDGRCVDVLKMIFNWRLVVTARTEGAPHIEIEAGWCYFGTGVDEQGRARSMDQACLRAMAAARVWDGTGEPLGYDKRAL